MASISIILSRQRTTKVLIKLRRCSGWSALLLFTNAKQIFSWQISECAKMCRLIWVFVWHTCHFISFAMSKHNRNRNGARWKLQNAMTQISLHKVFTKCFCKWIVNFLSMMNEYDKMSHLTRKHVFRSLRPGKTQTGLLSYRSKMDLETLDIASIGIIVSKQWTTKALTRLHGWHKTRFPDDLAH